MSVLKENGLRHLIIQILNKLNTKLDKPTTPPTVSGNILKVKSVNEDGTFVCEWADDNGGAVDDVKIVGESIVGENGVAEIPKCTNKAFGVAKLGNSATCGIITEFDGSLKLSPPMKSYIDIRFSHSNGAITPPVLDYAVKRAMTDGIGAEWTDTEKTGAWKRLNSIKTVMDEVAVAGAQYYLGEVTELNITLPEDAEIGQEIAISWYNGDTASTLAIDGIMLDFDYTPSANTRSEISCLWDGTYWSVIGISQDVPSEVVASE